MGIQMKGQFPESRRQDPKRQAEARVFDALAGLECNGHCLYEFRYRDHGQQVDYALWLHGVGRFAIEVKGGDYEMPAPGEWALTRPDGGRITVPSPVDEAADGTIEMRSAILESTGFKNFVAAILLFPDMDRDERIERSARRSSCVHTVWGLDRLESGLERVAELAEFRRPPLSKISKNEWSKLYELQFGGALSPDAAGEAAQNRDVRDIEMPGGRLTIRADVVNVYVGGDGLAGGVAENG